MFLPRHLSVSSVALYVTCPAAWKAKYVDRLVLPSNSPMAFGKAFHTALEAEHRGENSERAMIAAWNIGDADVAASGQTLQPDKVHALKLLDEYKRQGLGGKMGEPERQFKLRLLAPNVPVPVLGYIDLVVPERRRFREFKTTSTTTWTYEKVALERQLAVYGRAYQELYHHRVDCAEYCVFRTDIVQVDVIEAVPSADGFRLFELEAEAMWQGVKDGNFEGCGRQSCAVCRMDSVAKPSAGPTVEWVE